MSFLDNLKEIFLKPKKKKIEPLPQTPQVSPVTQNRAQEIITEAREEALKIRREAQEEANKLRNQEAEMARKMGALEEKEKYLVSKDEELKSRLGEIDKVKQDQVAKLERAAGLTREEAKNLILAALEERLKEDIAKRIKEAEAKAKEEADNKAREILVEAMRHGATDYVAEYTVSTVKLGDEELKGRIIGKEGRNIRAFEVATGVDVDLDEEGVIRLSSFDPIRREVAKVALEKLMADGRIQPGRIEELVTRVKQDLEKIMFTEGEKLAHNVGVYNLPADKLALLGRFKYRFSYGQNMIAHTLEETKIGVALAQEVGANINIVRLGCLLHDIGKVITEEEGTHVSLAVDLLKKNGMPEAVIACVEEHHEDKPFSSIESMIVYIADAISGARPGARYEDYEEYLKRLTDLEAIAKTKEGVKEAYAFQAGREIRVIVDPGVLDDAAATVLAQKIKDEIEKKLTYPGQVKVTVIRELRITETAK
ncbi:MAG: ribonuclease Y [Patescibacteria group bacterium]|nr:ribonuclease Y [Patescibacteria group bacterium]MCL5095540.1 ribonuclease Y [Patescibacteria group bacterium]